MMTSFHILFSAQWHRNKSPSVPSVPAVRPGLAITGASPAQCPVSAVRCPRHRGSGRPAHSRPAAPAPAPAPAQARVCRSRLAPWRLVVAMASTSEWPGRGRGSGPLATLPARWTDRTGVQLALGWLRHQGTSGPWLHYGAVDNRVRYKATWCTHYTGRSLNCWYTDGLIFALFLNYS